MSTQRPAPTKSLASAFGLVLAMASVFGPACSNDDDASPPPSGGMCTNSGGPVEDGAVDMHCIDDSGNPITQVTGKCETGSVDTGAAGAGGGASEDETYVVHTTSSAQDDDCKYDVSFSVDCVVVNQPATFTVKIDKRAAPGGPMTGDDPNSPEVYLASDPSHITPSNDIKATEGPAGTYKIGPIIFDESGRWVIRFHFNEECNDTPDDSPHGHVAFYIDVP
ncbi:MAG TPA: hypothetical protein VMI54_27210 [Polyangiaceae bacterium]|nr:hypothetical protein [Polyangiaceae bacterium]